MKKQIRKIWGELGRSPAKLKINRFNDEELSDVLEKLKAIKYSFDLLFSKQDGVDLATEVLKSVFKNGK